jgi:hypothetical protein
MPNTLKDLLLGKGWAGTTISRSETIERLNPLIKQFMTMNRHYKHVVHSHGDPGVVETLKDMLKTARTDVGKLSETVLSCGGAAYNGTDLSAEDVDLANDDTEMLFQLQDMEEAFQDAVEAEINEVEHQMRTRAILNVVLTNSQQRLDTLRSMTRGAHRSTV